MKFVETRASCLKRCDIFRKSGCWYFFEKNQLCFRPLMYHLQIHEFLLFVTSYLSIIWSIFVKIRLSPLIITLKKIIMFTVFFIYPLIVLCAGKLFFTLEIIIQHSLKVPGVIQTESDDVELTNINKLRDDLMRNYNSKARPVKHHSTTVQVLIGMVVTEITDLVFQILSKHFSFPHSFCPFRLFLD